MPYLIHNAIAFELLENSSNTFIHFLLSPVQTDATLLDVTCYVRLHTLFLVVGCCCVLLREVWNRSNFSANNSQYFLFRDHRNVTQHAAASVCTALPALLGPRTLIAHGLQRLMGCILPTMHYMSQHFWELLRPFARSLWAVKNSC